MNLVNGVIVIIMIEKYGQTASIFNLSTEVVVIFYPLSMMLLSLGMGSVSNFGDTGYHGGLWRYAEAPADPHAKYRCTPIAYAQRNTYAYRYRYRLHT